MTPKPMRKKQVKGYAIVEIFQDQKVNPLYFGYSDVLKLP